MLPILVASYLNATSAAFGARAALAGQSTDPALVDAWASAKPSDCALTEETGAVPAYLQTGCTTSHGEGAVAWSVRRFCDDLDDWLLYCTGDTWTKVTGNTMSQFAAGGQTWAVVQPDTDKSRPDIPESWLQGTTAGNKALNAKCDDTAPSGFRNGGALMICVGGLANGNFVAAICTKGVATDTPACADSFMTLNGGEIGSADCPAA